MKLPGFQNFQLTKISKCLQCHFCKCKYNQRTELNRVTCTGFWRTHFNEINKPIYLLAGKQKQSFRNLIVLNCLNKIWWKSAFMVTLKAIYLLKWPRWETFSDHSAHVMTLSIKQTIIQRAMKLTRIREKCDIWKGVSKLLNHCLNIQVASEFHLIT